MERDNAPWPHVYFDTLVPTASTRLAGYLMAFTDYVRGLRECGRVRARYDLHTLEIQATTLDLHAYLSYMQAIRDPMCLQEYVRASVGRPEPAEFLADAASAAWFFSLQSEGSQSKRIQAWAELLASQGTERR